jgi:DNA polymerase III subunit epsilon
MREIVLDTETTGLNSTEGHRIVEIGAVEIVHHSPTGATFHKLINPERDVPEEAVRVHGHTNVALKSMPTFATIVEQFLGFLGESRLVIHNADFDIGFLNAELRRLGRQPIDMNRVVDTLSLARKIYPGQPNSLDALCDRYGINRSRRVRHGALVDAEILVEVYGELTGGKQGSLIFEKVSDPAPVFVSEPTIGQCRSTRKFILYAQETTAHTEHVVALGNAAIWLRYRGNLGLNA